MTRTKQFWIGGLAILLIIVLGGVGYFLHAKNRPIIPGQMARQISFTVYWPHSKNAKPDKSTLKYDSQAGVFSYVASLSGVSATTTEQATPSQFVDEPNYFTALVNHLHNYDTFGSAVGNVYLTKPDNTSGQTAVINHNGTLLFTHAQGNVSENNWRLFFNNLKVVEN